MTGWSTTSKQSRGYGAEWERKRRRVLERDGHRCRCAHCAEAGRLTLATEVDHVVSRGNAKRLGWPDERTESEENLQAIGALCHRRKTQEERGRRHRAARAFGADGFPT